MKVSIDLPDDIEILWPDMIMVAKKNGVLIDGDMHQGSFSINGIKASYVVDGKTITASADKVPWFLEGIIKKEIKKWFNSRK